MEATPTHYFFANDWPARIWLAAFPILFSGGAASATWPLLIMPMKWSEPFLFLGLVMLFALLGWFVGILIGWPVIGPLYYDRSLKNGEPFQVGESVQILSGPYRDQVVPVIEVFDHGDYAGAHRVRVQLGERVKKGEDVFESIRILRVSPALSRGDGDSETVPDERTTIGA